MAHTINLGKSDNDYTVPGADYVVNGEAGDDTIHGGVSGDTLNGGTGFDYLHDFSGANFLSGGDADDTVVGVGVLHGDIGDDFLSSNRASWLEEGEHAQMLATTLDGMGGDDTLSGGKGNDILEGGSGADTFVFLNAAANGADRIVDFEHGIDRLSFNHEDYDIHAGFTVGSHAVVSGAQFLWNAATETLYYDHDGVGGDGAIALATFGAGVTVTASDLHFT